MRCIIIDDEPMAVNIIESYLIQIGGVEIVAKCTNPLEAITVLNNNQIDLVFLDIEMPNLTGIDLVKAITNMPQFIFTTAYPEYAVDGFSLNAVDYLVKPIPFNRFLKAFLRAKEKFEIEKSLLINTSSAGQVQEKPKTNNFIFIKSEYENVKIKIEDIKYIQGLKDYIKIYTVTTNRAQLTRSNFKDILMKLPDDFLRVHRSYIVNIEFVSGVQKNNIVINDVRIPIGQTYRENVMLRLGI